MDGYEISKLNNENNKLKKQLKELNNRFSLTQSRRTSRHHSPNDKVSQYLETSPESDHNDGLDGIFSDLSHLQNLMSLLEISHFKKSRSIEQYEAPISDQDRKRQSIMIKKIITEKIVPNIRKSLKESKPHRI